MNKPILRCLFCKEYIFHWYEVNEKRPEHELQVHDSCKPFYLLLQALIEKHSFDVLHRKGYNPRMQTLSKKKKGGKKC